MVIIFLYEYILCYVRLASYFVFEVLWFTTEFSQNSLIALFIIDNVRHVQRYDIYTDNIPT